MRKSREMMGLEEASEASLVCVPAVSSWFGFVVLGSGRPGMLEVPGGHRPFHVSVVGGQIGMCKEFTGPDVYWLLETAWCPPGVHQS